MSDEKSEIEKGIDAFKSVTSTLESDAVITTGWVKTHVALIIGLAAFVLGWATRFIHL
jgi:hypothetical protein